MGIMGQGEELDKRMREKEERVWKGKLVGL
jgi:hypothetical protein